MDGITTTNEVKKSLPKRAMTDREKLAANTLVKCRFLPGSYNKAFAKALYHIANGSAMVTERQVACLWKLVYAYRRQISDQAIVTIADEMLHPVYGELPQTHEELFK